MVRAEVRGASIAGGFVRVPVAGLMAAWRACRSAPLGIGDFRAWLACREMVARRCVADPGREPAYTHAELARLAGVSERRARASAGRLAAAGLLEWSGSAIGFPGPAAGADPALADTIGAGSGSLAIPRRILRLLADGARPALIATVLGLLLRCLSRRRGGFDGRGRVKASWIAGAFGVDLRRVKAARRELVALGWIEPEPAPRWATNRWGGVYRIRLDWGRADGRPLGRGCSTLPPPPAAVGPTLPPPGSDQDPLRERIKNQEPAPGGPDGVELRGAGEKDRPLPTPDLNDVRPEDLKDTARLLELHRQAVDRRLIGPSEAERLNFVAAAEHARAIGTKNPCGLFAFLIRGGHWRYITQDDEDRANTRLKAYQRGPIPLPVARVAVRAVLSEDARVAGEVRRSFAAAGYRGDPFPHLRRHDPGWTRERWDAALREAGGGGTAPGRGG